MGIGRIFEHAQVATFGCHDADACGILELT